MKKLLLTLVEFLSVFTFALLIASCGGGGGGGGSSDFYEPDPEPVLQPEPQLDPEVPVQNENSILNMQAPTYSDVNLGISNSLNRFNFSVGESVTFTANAGYESYAWYVDGNLLGTENSFAYTASGSAPHQLMLIVRKGDNYFGETKVFTVSTAAN
ncbi:MAG: hypothetical protein IKN90_09115 [Treponema sp.]|nr:hypothetical protein [Treponema sp.]